MMNNDEADIGMLQRSQMVKLNIHMWVAIIRADYCNQIYYHDSYR